MNYSQKYTLVAFLKPLEVGAEFHMSDWPLHITLADVFAIGLSPTLEQQLAELLEGQPPVELSVGEDATLGTTNVALVNKTNELQNLHEEIVDVLEQNGVIFNTPEFTRSGFLPHSTIQKSGRLHTGDTFHITSVSLVDMFPNGDWQQRKVLHNFALKKASNNTIPTIKAVIFDVGGVLIDISSAIRDNIAAELGVGTEQFSTAWKELVLLHGAGKIDEQDFWNQLSRRCSFDPAQYSSSIISEVFAQQLVIRPNVLALANKLLRAGLVTAILSDTIDAHAKVLRDNGVYDTFSPVLLSYEIGIRKPAPEAFTYALRVLGIAPDEAIFIDDRSENVEGAQTVGIHGLVFRGPQQLEQELRQFIPNF